MSNEELVSFKNSADQDVRERHNCLVVLREKVSDLMSPGGLEDNRFIRQENLERYAAELDEVYQEFLAFCDSHKINSVLGREDVPPPSWSDQMLLEAIYKFCTRELAGIQVRFPEVEKTRLKIFEKISFGLPSFSK